MRCVWIDDTLYHVRPDQLVGLRPSDQHEGHVLARLVSEDGHADGTLSMSRDVLFEWWLDELNDQPKVVEAGSQRFSTMAEEVNWDTGDWKFRLDRHDMWSAPMDTWEALKRGFLQPMPLEWAIFDTDEDPAARIDALLDEPTFEAEPLLTFEPPRERLVIAKRTPGGQVAVWGPPFEEAVRRFKQKVMEDQATIEWEITEVEVVRRVHLKRSVEVTEE